MTTSSIDIETLREEINRHLDMFIANGVSQVELARDYYWDFDWAERYLEAGSNADPPKAAIGSLRDDIEFVLSARDSGRVALTLCHIAPLVNYLGISAGDHGVFQEKLK